MASWRNRSGWRKRDASVEALDYLHTLILHGPCVDAWSYKPVGRFLTKRMLEKLRALKSEDLARLRWP